MSIAAKATYEGIAPYSALDGIVATCVARSQTSSLPSGGIANVRAKMMASSAVAQSISRRAKM